MSLEVLLRKTPDGAMTPEPIYADHIEQMPVGQYYRAVLTKPRNPAFHRKGFALFKVAYDAWDKPETEFRGEPVATSFDRFRKDLTILAGHYDLVTNVRGEVRAEAKSLSWGSMDETEFMQVYSDIINAVLKHILKGKTREELDAWVDRVLEFA